MDADPEVVREPFEGGESTRYVDLSPDDFDIYATAEILARRFQLDKTTSTPPLEQKVDNSNQHYDDSSSENNSASFIEDVKFAESFGITLKGKNRKNELAYDSLMKSTHFQSSDKPKTLIDSSVTSDCIYHKGTYYQKGDIVSLYDQDDNHQLYFAQLSGFLQDQYCEKSASVNWLVPIKRTSREFFDPSAYKIGLVDTRLRKMDCMTFVCHCPHDYYLRKLFQTDGSTSSNDNQAGQAVSRGRSKKEQNYIWTTMEPCRVPGYTARVHDRTINRK